MKKLIAVLGLLAAAQEGQAWAATFDVANGQTLTTAQTLATGQTGTIETGGKLSVAGTAVAISVTGNASIQNYGMLLETGTGRAIRDNTGGLTLTLTNYAGALIQTADADVIQMNKANSNVTVYNYGTMTSINASAGGSQAVDFNAITTGSNSVYNYSTGVLQANEADAVRPGVNGFVYNDGLIKATNNPGSTDGSDGIDAQTNSGITVVNATTGTASVAGTGMIEGARHGITGGNTDVTTSGAYVLNVTNNLGGTIQGDNGSGINIDGFNANEVVTVVNHGTITGNGVSSDGDGVDVDGLVNITNTGTIQSLHAYDDASEGVTVGGGAIVNSGTIVGLNSATNADGTANTGVGRGITLAGIDKDPTTGLPIPIEGIYANTSVTNSGLIRGQTTSGIAVTGAANAFTVGITNLAGGTIEGGGATAAALATGGNNATVINYGTITADSSNLAVDLGSGNSSLQILGGAATINGNISGGSGSSALTIAPGAGNGFGYAGDISNFSSVAIGAGTVTLSGSNTYTGATTVTGGTLSVAADTNLGATTSTLTLDGGTLQVTGTAFNSTARSIVLGSAGGSFDIANAGNAFTLSQALSGTGSLTKLGAGTLLLSGANTYSGGTTISDGTLQGNTSSLQGAIADNATLAFDQSTDGVFAGAISGSGALNKSGASTLTLTGANSYSGGTTISAGTLRGDTSSLQGDIADSAALIFDQANNGTFAGAISGTGSLTKTGAGALTLNGASSLTGASEILAGEVLIGGDGAHASASIGGDVTVDGNSTLGGFGSIGSIGGNVLVQTGGHLSPGNGTAVGTLSINGNLSLAQNSQLDFAFGTPGASFNTFGAGDSVKVGGNLALNGSVLNISDAGGFGPGLYNLFSYAGTLTETNGGIALGNTPSGNFAIQNLTGDKQINLLDTTGATLNFWNANGLASATQAGGGSGTWTTTSLNWTNATGSVTSAMQPQPGFAIFGGAPGTVTVSNSSSAVSATGMQFVSNGYTLTGDTLTLVGSNGAAPIIRVGDGSSAGSGDTATIGNVIAGSAGVNKADLGTLVLTGNNTYSGGTTISGGTLSVGSDANLGSAGSSLTLDGGTLQVTGTGFASTARDITLGSAGGGFDIADAGNSFTVTPALGGTGALAKLGAGTLVLSGANTYTGGTTISAGTLQGSSISLQGNIADNAALAFDQTTDGTYAGVISGSGTLTKIGSGTLSLGGANTYTGGTTIGAGTLQGNSTSLQGNIVDNAALAFDQDTDGTYTGAVSGSGSLSKTGSGTLTLGGANSYTGGTMISAGTLQGDTSSLQGHIADNAALVFNQSSDGTFAGAISGAGALTKSGSGTLTVDGINAFTGATNVASGTLVVGDASHATASLGGSVTVASGATLGGIGSVGGLNLLGTMAPGNAEGIGQLSVTGNAVFHSGSAYRIDAAPDGSSDRIAIGGSASLLGGSALALAQGGTWAPSTTYTVLTANGGVNGTFGSVSSNFAFLTPSLSYTTSAVNLTLLRNDVGFVDIGQTPNQRSTAGALDAVGATGPLYSSLVTLDASTARTAFDQLSGESYASTKTALIDDSRYVRDAINRHLIGASNGADGAQSSSADGVTAWTSGWGQSGEHDSNGNASRLTDNGGGLLVGADVGIGSNARLGAVVGYGENTADVSQLNASARTTGTSLGIYGSTSFGAFALRGGADYAWQDVDSTRHIAFGNYSDFVSADYHARTAQAFIEGGYRIDVSQSQQLEPFLNLARVQLQTDGANEGGGTAALDVAGDHTDVNTATLGLRDTWLIDSAAGGIHAYASLGFQQGWGDLTPTTSMRFATGSDSFAISGVPVAQHALAANAGLSFPLARNATVDASYLGQFASHAQDQAVRVSLQVRF